MKSFLASTAGKIIAGILTLAVVGSVATAVVFMNSGYRTIAVKALNGITEITNNGKMDFAYAGLHLKAGDDIRVKSNSDLTLSLDEDKFVFADADTHFWIETEGKAEDNRTKIHLEEGSSLFRIDKKLTGDEYFDVDTPNSTMSVRGTIFRVTCYKDENGEYITEVEVFEGQVETEPVMLDGNKTGVVKSVESNRKVIVRADSTVSEFVTDEEGNDEFEIDFNDFPKGAAEFLGEAIDDGRELFISKELLYDYAEVTEHKYDLREDEVEATYEEEGYFYPKCSVCGKVSEDKVVIPKLQEEEVDEEAGYSASEIETADKSSSSSSSEKKVVSNSPEKEKSSSSKSKSSSSSSSNSRNTNSKNSSFSNSSKSGNTRNTTTGNTNTTNGNNTAKSSSQTTGGLADGVTNSSTTSSTSPSSSNSTSSSSSSTSSADSDEGDSSDDENYIVTFATQSGTFFAAEDVASGEKAKIPVFQPSQSGYWTYNGSSFDFDTPITKNMLVKWKEQ